MAESGRAAPWLQRQNTRITLTLHLQPGAGRTEFAGIHGDALKIRIQAPPVDGKANDALLRFLATTFDVPLQRVSLLRGAGSRRKTVEIRDAGNLPKVIESLLGT